MRDESERELCDFCERRFDMHNGPSVAHKTWRLRHHGEKWSIHVEIENEKMGIAMTAELPINNCPICGREL